MKSIRRVAIAALILAGLAGCATNETEENLGPGATTGGNPSSPQIPSTR